MKKTTKLLLCLSVVLFLLTGCTRDTKKEVAAEQELKSPEDIIGKEQVTLNEIKEESDTEDKKEDLDTGEKDGSSLSLYSSEQIEFARVWLQLGFNQEIDELNAQRIPSGTLINPNDHTSTSYPVDVIQLAGSRLVDGSVTYSGNGDGTINVYNVPLRWDGNYPAGENFYKEIIENTKLVYVEPNDEEKIIRLISLLNIHH